MEKNNTKKGYELSIVIPICNNPDYLLELLTAVVNQTHNYVEIIVVDGSDKDRLELDKQHITLFGDERIKHIIHKDKQGASYAMTIGMEKATGKFSGFLYRDNQWKPDREEVKTNGILKLFTNGMDKLKGV